MDFATGPTFPLENPANVEQLRRPVPRAQTRSLGNNGRDVLRREITKRLRAFPHLRVVANRTAPVRFATVPQLHQIAEDVGIGEIAAAISEADQAHRRWRKQVRTEMGRRKSTGGRSDVNVKEAITDKVEALRWSFMGNSSAEEYLRAMQRSTSETYDAAASSSHINDFINLDMHLPSSAAVPSSIGAPFHSNINSFEASTFDASAARVSPSPPLCWDNAGVTTAPATEINRMHELLALQGKNHEQPFTEHGQDYTYREYLGMRHLPASPPASILWDINGGPQH